MGATFFLLLLITVTVISIILIVLGISKGKKLKHNPTLISGIIMLCFPILFSLLFVVNNYEQFQYEKSLDYAVDNRDINRVAELLNSGINPDDCYRGTYTPLMMACTGDGRYDIARLLVKHGSNVNKEFLGYDDGSQKGYTSLFYAVQSSNLDLVLLLVENGADINHQSEDGMTPLMRACETSNYKVVKLLIDKGADANAIDREGKTVLCHACNPDYYAIYSLIKGLLAQGADVNYKTSTGKTLADLVLINKFRVKEHHLDYDTFDFGEGVIGFEDNYKKILNLLDK